MMTTRQSVSMRKSPQIKCNIPKNRHIAFYDMTRLFIYLSHQALDAWVTEQLPAVSAACMRTKNQNKESIIPNAFAR